MSGKVTATAFDYDYLRFELGRYGAAALTTLSKDPNPDTARLASLAQAKKRRWGAESILPAQDIAKHIEVYPKGATVDPAFLDYLSKAAKEQAWQHSPCLYQLREPCLMLLIDMNGDGQQEILSLGTAPQVIYSNVNGNWTRAGSLLGKQVDHKTMETWLRESRVQTERPIWLDLRVGEERFTVQPDMAP